MSSQQYILSDQVQFRICDKTSVELMIHGDASQISMAEYLVLMKFSRPTSLSRALEGSQTRERAKLKKTLDAHIRSKLLVSPGRASRGSRKQAPSIERVLNKRVWSKAAIAKIRGELKRDRVCIIRNAFEPRFAKSIARELEAATSWQLFDVYRPFFSYHFHQLQPRSEYSPKLLECAEMFESDKSKSFVESLAGVDCQGAVEFDASVYLPGDYTLPHTDNVNGRSVAYLWYLPREWKPSWGGQLYLCRSGQSIMPTFNTLILFRVLREYGDHLVGMTSPFARVKRLAINGWWKRSEVGKRNLGESFEGNRWYSGDRLLKVAKDIYSSAY